MKNNHQLKNKEQKHKKIYVQFLLWGWSMLFLFASSCSTTKHLPEGEVLYTGIKDIEILEKDTGDASDEALEEVEAALSYPPNNSLFGSSTKRIPFPIGLWIYNGFIKYEKGIGKWIFEKFAAKPVFISTVNPQARATVARNVLRENGYFDGYTSFEIIPDKKDSLKAKISYSLEMNHPYTYDSIRYVRFRHRADTLIRESMNNTFLKKDDNFNVIKLENERQRISTLLRNNGFYYYRPEFIVYEADTLLTPGKVWLRVTRKPGVPMTALRPWKIGDISVYLNDINNEGDTDSVKYKDITIYHQGKLRIRPAVLYSRFYFKPGDTYTQEAQQKTQTGLSRLSAFRYSEMQYVPKDSSRRNDILNVNVNTVYDLPMDGELEFNVTSKSNNQLGPGAIFSVTRRNLFHGGEILGVQLRGSYEWQTGNRVDNGNSKINSYELGISSTLSFPFLLFPGYINRDLVNPSTTTFRISADQMNRARFFKMLSFGGSMTYDFQPTPLTKHSVVPFRLSYNLLQSTTHAFDTITEKNPALRQSLQDQFIPAMSYTFTYDNSSSKRLQNYTWWETSITQSGNILGGIYALAGKDFDKQGKKLFGNPFSQFIKGTSELRYNYRIDRNNRLVGRVMAGAIYSYGNARISPYSEQFFVGGSNSLRAFTIRSIGPGRFAPDENNKYAYLDQTGDLKFEANLEYRFNIVGDLYGATFLDWGGIWLIREDTNRPGGTLKASKFFNDLALGTGLGIRYDLNFLVIRVDAGYPLHIPYDNGKSGYFNFPRRYWDNISWHLAIGYPF